MFTPVSSRILPITLKSVSTVPDLDCADDSESQGSFGDNPGQGVLPVSALLDTEDGFRQDGSRIRHPCAYQDSANIFFEQGYGCSYSDIQAGALFH